MKNLGYLVLLFVVLSSCGEQNTTSIEQYSPTGLAAVLLSDTQVQLSWIDNSTSETGFLVQRAREEEEFVTINTNPANLADYLDEEVQESVNYRYRVAALFNEEQSDWSNTAYIFTQSVFSDMGFGDEEGFDIMTWNLEHFPKNNQITVAYVTQVLNMLQIDVIALQEIQSSYYFELLDSNLDDWTGYLANSAAYDLNLAYLFRNDTLSGINIYEIYQNENYPFPRSPLVMECEFGNEDLVIINNHLKASDGEENENRRRQACILLEEYIETNFIDNKVIVLGDLNDDITEPEEDNVFWNFIQEEENYLFTDMEIAMGDPAFWSYPSWPSHLDHILITAELFSEFEDQNSVIETIRVDQYMEGLWNEYDTNISDHRPVALKLYLE